MPQFTKDELSLIKSLAEVELAALSDTTGDQDVDDRKKKCQNILTLLAD